MLVSTCSDVRVVLIILCMLASTVGAWPVHVQKLFGVVTVGVDAIGVRTLVPRC